MTEELDPAKYHKMVCKIANRFKHCGLSEEDLIAEGYLGLTKAQRKFDPSQGYAFSTYAYPWIVKTVQQAIEDQVPLVSVPSNVQQRIRHKNSKAYATDAAIADGRQAMRRHTNEATIESGDTGASLSSIAFSRNNDLAQRLAALDLASLMHGMHAIDAEVIRLLYGLDGRPEMTVPQIAKHFAKSNQWIYQVEARAMEHLRQRAAASSRRVSA